ncbi:MAG: hypothetical protein OEL76_03925 [Siculibacillus sp.]|nr:hypothetical protein [Siculibacillus sp.]
MGIFAPGLHDEKHRRAFLEAAARTRFGAVGAPVCGAKTRDGATCKKRPLSGERRCLRHAGPAAAKRYHERLFEAFGRGEITFEAWQEREHRRLANRLPRLWAENPWAPGMTIDLGDLEEKFRGDLALGGVNADALSPAARDRARWRWRRLCCDRRRPVEWAAFLRDELPKRIRRDGPRPPDTDAGTAVAALFRVDAAPPPMSKRRRLDPPRLPATAPKPRLPRVGRAGPTISDERLADLWAEHGATLTRLVGDDGDERTLRWLAGLLARVLDAPEDTDAAGAWRAAVLARRTG